MKAMVLAAGLGTRLRPLTDDRPKALVEVGGRRLLEITLLRLKNFGVREVIVNVHHFADKVVDYLKAHQNFGLRIEISREDELLLDTGGGLKNAAWFFLQNGGDDDEPLLLHNVDVVSTIDLDRMLEAHSRSGSLATLAVQHRDSSRVLLFDDELRLCGRRKGRDLQPELVGTVQPRQELAFSGIHLISKRFLSLMKEDGAFSIIDSYLRVAGEGGTISGFRADEYYWRDLGKLKDLEQAERDLEQKVFSI
jgi:mannose-1-phosphate guanylyltransferase